MTLWKPVQMLYHLSTRESWELSCIMLGLKADMCLCAMTEIDLNSPFAMWMLPFPSLLPLFHNHGFLFFSFFHFEFSFHLQQTNLISFLSAWIIPNAFYSIYRYPLKALWGRLIREISLSMMWQFSVEAVIVLLCCWRIKALEVL